MKRGADGDMGSPQKRSRRGDEEVRLLIPSKVAGSIIGKGGQNITKLRSQYKASITVPDCPGPERLLTLSSDLDSVCNIIRDVMPNLEENGATAGNGNDLDVRMMIHQSQAGCVIGKGGQKIKEIREKIGARIKIFSNVAPQSTDRVIQIIGEAAKCVETVREVLTLIKSNPIKGAVNPYDPHNFDDVYPEEYGGWGNHNIEGGRGSSGGGGGSFRGGRGGSAGPRGGGGHSLPPPRGGIRDGGGRFGSRGGGFGNRNSNFDRPSGGGRSFGDAPFGNRNRPPPFGDRNGWSSSSASFNNPPAPLTSSIQSGPPSGSGSIGLGVTSSTGGKNSTQVTIPKDLAGAIIGKGGGRIRKIRQDSGAGITIDEPLPGSNDRIITITGSPNEIQMAQYLLQQSVHNNSERNNF
ncbi:heterogeneous nuclear ribonucleoprotein K [Cylas formicarius]|uniref:heterogeneous nuclear ribonucleoprotein K n=1 Tax=Cylas formicarius TaxID=197179 RepID=UPI0029589BD0|nr:heterogeneous nuclear ribonucleoprotein K [Cylas formicarius]XP_060537149.1 heterogeneous nuclear ribonucleoprotein K [Cylas formicarius]XP_060537158.1 heterogeneous nuclear ribonucleoprotein K [Cylas formicarius]XP_060537167.1 heterogeneous nuclear ribonucleoprotein K [Cylas formicarius]XP_060537176.1 heterogeneous nuclear ribonucleoprotein K [Cylas formicarius]XP_060537185.1 heterogeneous nuclear ribonucleoprotein K [Cylas formicarius]